MVLSIIQCLAPRLRNNSLSCDPTTFINGLKSIPSRSHKDFHSKAYHMLDILLWLKEDCGPHKLVTRCLEQLHLTTNCKCPVDCILLLLRLHLWQHADTTKNMFHFNSYPSPISIIREEMLDHRLDCPFIFYVNTHLYYNQATVRDSIADQVAEEDNYFELLNHKANFKNNNSKFKLFLRPMLLECTLCRCGSDDPDNYPCRGDVFLLE